MKKYLIFIIVISIMICSNLSVYAYNDADNQDSLNNQLSKIENLTSFINLISPFYSSTEKYCIINNNGDNISSKMYYDTVEYARKGDWISVYNYFSNNVFSLEVTHTEYSTNLKSDLSRRESKSFVRKLKPISGIEYQQFDNLYLYVNMEGTIYYDPNTYKINNTSFAVSSATMDDSGMVKVTKSPVSLSSNKLTARFVSSFDCKLPIDDVSVFTTIIFAKETFEFSLSGR